MTTIGLLEIDMNPYLDELATRFEVLRTDKELYNALADAIEKAVQFERNSWWCVMDADADYIKRYVGVTTEEEPLCELDAEKAHADECPLQDYDDYVKWAELHPIPIKVRKDSK